MRTDWDVVVAGSGPAGSAAAISVLRERPDARVLLLDRSAFPRDKVCGDGVAPHALDVLAELGVDVDALVEGYAPVHTLRLRSPAGYETARQMGRPCHVVPRAVFDARLLQAARAAGAEIRRHQVRTVREVGDHVVVDEQLRADVLIGADGAESAVRRSLPGTARRSGTVAVAIRGYAGVGTYPGDEQLLTMTRSHWPAYAWVFPLGDGTANVGYGELLRGRPTSRAQLLDRLGELLPSLAPSGLRAHRLPLTSGRAGYGRGRVLLAGDAASLINPLTGEGIFYAVLSGALAGRAAALGQDAAIDYTAAMRARLGGHLRHTDFMARLTRHPRVIDAGICAAAAHQDAFDETVELGLGEGRVSGRTLWRVARHALVPPRPRPA